MAADRTSEDKRQIALQVSQYLDHNGKDRSYLIGGRGLSKSTVDHFFGGTFTERTLARINAKLGTSFGSIERAPSWCGGYGREEAAEYEGTYLTIRPHLRDRDKITAYLTHFSWANRKDAFVFDGQIQFEPRDPTFGLVFREERTFEPDRAHSGQVWMPKGSHIFLFTTYGEGRLRAAIVSDLDRQNRLKGIQLTQAQVHGVAFVPAACPIVFWKDARYASQDLGIIDDDHSRYEEYKALLIEAEKSIIWSSSSFIMSQTVINDRSV